MLSQASVRLLRRTYRTLVKPSALPESDNALLRANRGWDAVPLPRTWFIAFGPASSHARGSRQSRCPGVN